MGLERLWLLGVTTAVALCLLRTSHGVEAVVRARVGGTAELSCSLTPPSTGAITPNLFPLHVVEWVRLGYNVPILIKFGVYAPRVHPNYKGRVSLTRGASLLVEGLSLEDEGWFECRILLLDRTTDEFRNGTWTFLSITAPPVFIKTPPTFVEVLQGDSLALSCGAHGNPRPTVIWHKDETPIEKHEKMAVLNGTLSLATVTRETSGMYKCQVSNSEGNLTHTTQLQVKGPPLIIIAPEDTTLNISQDAVLQCQAEAYPSNLTYEWWKQGQNVYHIEYLKTRVKILVDGTLLIPSLVPEDTGNYTCIPTNGLMTSPSASAHLKVQHPARVGRMPRETYLPTGMGGVIFCPVQAEPPMIFVNWTKDGNNLNLDNFPGWLVNAEGSVFIATANDNAVGMYTCTAYNSYGTMGQSEPTKVMLQDPPSFSVSPRAEYLQEVGGELVIPCEADGDPSPNITWSKVGPIPRSPYTVLSNGSLLLKPLSKDHQGGWECLATNRVATVGTATVVLVLGTSPHAASSVSVSTGMNQANVSWEPGFDGGYTQKFTVWVKQTSRGKHEWGSISVPTSKSHLLVTGLLAGTSYQFSVLSQNKLGSGPFSEITSVRTQALPTYPPTVVTSLPTLNPPLFLSANRTALGIVLQWYPPESQATLLTGYVLQARRDRGQWVILNSAVKTNQSELLVQGLLRDCSYDLRLMSRSNKLLSEPSESVNVDTTGMEMYPVRTGFLEFVPEPLLAGVLGGVCFLFVAIILSLVTACVMSHRRAHRRRKRRDDQPSAFQKSLSPEARSPSDSPDSVLKIKFCPPLSFFPSSSSSQADRSSFNKGSRGEYQDQRRQLLSSSTPPPHYTLFESHLGGKAPSPSALESILRGPDGRFIVQPLPEASTLSNMKTVFLQTQTNRGGSGTGSNRTSFRDSPKSSSLSSERGERKDSPLTVEVTELSKPPASPGRVRAMARNFSRHGCFYSDDEQGFSEALLERASFHSDRSEKRVCDSLKRYRSGHPEDIFPSLGRTARLLERDRHHLADYQPMERESQLTNASTLVSQIDTSEQKQDNLRKCLQLAKEREMMERELDNYTASQREREWEKEENQLEKATSPNKELGSSGAEDPIWKPQDITLRPKAHRASGQTHQLLDYRRACYFGNTSSPMDRLPSSYIQWDISPVTSVSSLVPVQSPLESTTPRSQNPHQRHAGLAMEDSLHVDCSRYPVTQCTSPSQLSPTSENPSISQGTDRNVGRARSRSPDRTVEREQDMNRRRSMVEEGWRETKQPGGGALKPRSSFAYGTQHLEPRAERSVSAARVRATSSGQPYPGTAPYSLSERTETMDDRERLNQIPSGYSTLPYELHKAGAKGKVRGDPIGDDPRSSLSNPEQEREGVRARSRRSDRALFNDSPSQISPLTLLEACESDQSQFSAARISESFKNKPATQAPKMSPLQTSAILEYLSLPGFIEMSVDNPGDESELTDTACKSIEPQTETSLEGKPDVVPKNWDVHVQEKQEKSSSQNTVSFLENRHFVGPAGISKATEKPDYRYSLQVQARDSSHSAAIPDRSKKLAPGSEYTGNYRYYEQSQPLISQKTTSSERPPTRIGLSPAQTLASAAKSMAEVVFKHTNTFAGKPESASEQSQRLHSQGNRTNKISSRIYQHPAPFIKKSLSIGPCRTLSGMGQPRPFIKKSISLGSQKWEHFERPRTYVSEKCYWDEFPNPDVQVKSYSLGRTPAYSFSRPDPSWREGVQFRQPSVGSLEKPLNADRSLERPRYDRSLASSSYTYLSPSMYPPRQPPVSVRQDSSDPCRQASAYPDAAMSPVTYQDALRSVEQRYVSMNSSIPQYLPRLDQYLPRLDQYPPRPDQYTPRPGMRGDYPRPMESKRGQPRPNLPRMYSWPSPYHGGPFPARDVDSHREAERGTGKGAGAEAEMRDNREGGRASYASQSSGRGSVGLLRQSLSITPILLSSPETTEESETQRHRAEMDLREWRKKRRNTSVDESYEWDSADVCVDLEVLEAMKPQAGVVKGRGQGRHDRVLSVAGLQDLYRKGPPRSVRPPVSNLPHCQYTRSLSEARFNALRLEYQEYRRSQGSSCTSDPCLPPDTDSDSNSALL
ncbi:protein turtle homolog A [Salmo trutta]|uniref:Protein turtle homolog A-like n=1 Tax=Salmo trutta TaxID=8032 RepID=A0A673WS83_SALTR|nr:protein turtle homolog A-like [Salmo trutta]